MVKTKFSRGRIDEFVNDLSNEAEKIVIILSAETDSALVYQAFNKSALLVDSGQSVVLGEVIPGSMPERHFMSIQDDVLDKQ